MELFLSYLNRHIDGSEHRLREKMKKSFDRIVKACKLSAEPAYSKWLHNKLLTYYPEFLQHDIDSTDPFKFDEPIATAWALEHIPDFEFLVQLIVAAHFQSWFGQWLSIKKTADMSHKSDMTDFEFE
jgi:hypothetical protein